MKLAGKAAIVTGAAAGIGAATALRFAQEGAHIVAIDIDAATLDQVTGTITTAGHECLGIPADVSKRADVDEVVRQALSHYGRIDILFNNAGIVPVGKIDAT